MIRTLVATVSLAIVTVLAGPPLLLYVALTGSVMPLYRAGVAAALWASRVAGMRIRVDGPGEYSRGTLPFRGQPHQ